MKGRQRYCCRPFSIIDWIFPNDKYDFRLIHLKNLFYQYAIEDSFSSVVPDICLIIGHI